MNAAKVFSSNRYAIITDESITIGKQKLLVQLAVPAHHPGHPLTHADTEIVTMSVSPSWRGEDVKQEIGKTIRKMEESTFSMYKFRQSPNKLCGVTKHILVLPIAMKLSTRENRANFDFKASMEAIRYADIKEWKDLYLLDNRVNKRTETLKKASGF